MTYEPVTLESLLAHRNWALRVARQLVHEDGEAEDLVQRTWVAALRNPPATERGARSWIRKVILNLARERHRRRLVRDRAEQATSRDEADLHDASELASEEEIRHLLSERVMQLGESYRAVLVARFYEGRTSAEIARTLGVPAGTVRWRLKIGLEQLRADLDRRSRGDRSRWVSALLAAFPGIARPPDGSAPAASATTSSLASTAGWVALAALSVLGIALLAEGAGRSADREAHAREPAPVAATLRPEEPPRSAERSAFAPAPLPSTPPGTAPGGRLAIVVVDPEGKAVPEARILVAGARGVDQRAVTDGDGRAWLEVRPEDPGSLGLPSTVGRVSLRALVPGRVASPLVHVEPPFDAGREVRLAVGGLTPGFRGHVVDPEGRPVAAALVAWMHPEDRFAGRLEGDFQSPSYLTTRSDEDGRFVLEGIEPRSGFLVCFVPGYAVETQSIEFDPSRPDYEVRLEVGATLTGCVRHPDGRPAAGVEIAVEPQVKALEWNAGLPGYEASWRGFGQRTRSDENGLFRLANLSSWHTRQVWAFDPVSGLEAATAMKLAAGTEAHWEAQLAPWPSLRLRVVDESGQPLEGWFVHARRVLRDEDWWVRRMPTDAEGRLVVHNCPPGDILIDVFDPTDVGPSMLWTRHPAGDEEIVLSVHADATGTISGQIVDESGQPVLGGLLRLRSLTTTLVTAIDRDQDGRFSVSTAPSLYALVLELDKTAVQLGRVKLRPFDRQDLGCLRTPPMGSLRLNGSALFDGTEKVPAFSVTLVSRNGERKGLLPVAQGSFSNDQRWLKDEVVLPVFPGEYRVLAFAGSGKRGRQYTVNVRSYEETRLALEPSDQDR